MIEAVFAGAFNPAAFTGGTIGSLFISMQKGVSRGIFSNEAGLGTGSIAHACADTKKPVKQGMFGIFEVFCGHHRHLHADGYGHPVQRCPGQLRRGRGPELTISGFTTTYGGWASIFTAVALCCFAFSTIIGWGCTAHAFIAFLCRSDKVVRPFFVVYSFVSILGATDGSGAAVEHCRYLQRSYEHPEPDCAAAAFRHSGRADQRNILKRKRCKKCL